jgi:hypothetical protein
MYSGDNKGSGSVLLLLAKKCNESNNGAKSHRCFGSLLPSDFGANTKERRKGEKGRGGRS